MTTLIKFYLNEKDGRLILDSRKYGITHQTIEAKNWLEARAQIPTEYYERKEGYGYLAEDNR